MSKHVATIRWEKNAGADFLKLKYSREHTWEFDGGATVAASSAPTIVPVPFSNPAKVDPEEAFIASVSSCHMLCFLSVAAEAGFVVVSYKDEAQGLMTRNEKGVLWISEIVLKPEIVYEGPSPTADNENRLHHESHERCFIANSIKTNVMVGKS